LERLRSFKGASETPICRPQHLTLTSRKGVKRGTKKDGKDRAAAGGSKRPRCKNGGREKLGKGGNPKKNRRANARSIASIRGVGRESCQRREIARKGKSIRKKRQHKGTQASEVLQEGVYPRKFTPWGGGRGPSGKGTGGLHSALLSIQRRGPWLESWKKEEEQSARALSGEVIISTELGERV